MSALVEWVEQAACRDKDPHLFYGDEEVEQRSDAARLKAARVSAALAVCEECPVMSECLEDAILSRDWWGIRGGLTPDHVKAMARARGLIVRRGWNPREAAS